MEKERRDVLLKMETRRMDDNLVDWIDWWSQVESWSGCQAARMMEDRGLAARKNSRECENKRD